jgi:hypothetical protein
MPDSDMQPSPIADTDGPLLPSWRETIRIIAAPVCPRGEVSKAARG